MRISDWSSDVCSSDLLEVDLAALVDVAEIAGVEETVGVEALGRLLAQVAQHQRRTPQRELAALTGAEGPTGVRVDHPQLDARQQPADREPRRTARAVRPVREHERSRLGETVTHQHDPAGVSVEAGVAGEGRLDETPP